LYRLLSTSRNTEAIYTKLLSAGLPFQEEKPQAQGMNSTAARGCVSSYSTGVNFSRRVPVTMQQQLSRVNDNNNKQGTTDQQKHKRTMIVVILLLRAKDNGKSQHQCCCLSSLLIGWALSKVCCSWKV
jgi:hypothetical protein